MRRSTGKVEYVVTTGNDAVTGRLAIGAQPPQPQYPRPSPSTMTTPTFGPHQPPRYPPPYQPPPCHTAAVPAAAMPAAAMPPPLDQLPPDPPPPPAAADPPPASRHHPPIRRRRRDAAAAGAAATAAAATAATASLGQGDVAGKRDGTDHSQRKCKFLHDFPLGDPHNLFDPPMRGEFGLFFHAHRFQNACGPAPG